MEGGEPSRERKRERDLIWVLFSGVGLAPTKVPKSNDLEVGGQSLMAVKKGESEAQKMIKSGERKAASSQQLTNFSRL